MDVRSWSRRWLPGAVAWFDRVNAAHPWSHNDHFHGWILRSLPDRRHRALDVGCGRGRLLERLAPYFEAVEGCDVDLEMRAASAARVAGQPSVTVHGERLADLTGPYDLITMVAVLHHLDARSALTDVRRLLAPGGRLLVVGLTKPTTLVDQGWDAWGLLTNPLIGLVKHPRRAVPGPDAGPGFPVRDPEHTFGELTQTFAELMPGARLRRRVGFRYTAAWTQPA
ncbi:MAG: class I SAM-dependent methyltransferase [Nocardioidaceae bacterium]|nr:class I SAM-dependent methyltransferase [Nocardioidaceae bacterium]